MSRIVLRALALAAAAAWLGCSKGAADTEAVGVAAQAVSDNTPPEIVCGPGDCSLTENVDVTQGSGTIAARARLRDDPAGVNVLSLSFRSPTGIQYLGLNLNEPCLLPGSGTLNDGVFEATATVPQYSESGTWTIMEGWIGDRAHNGRSVHESELAALGFPTTFTVASTPDTTPPLIACTGPGDCAMTPSVDVTQGPGTITARARLRDDLAGVNVLSLSFRSPTGIQYLGFNLNEPGLLPGSGTLNDGVFESTATVPQYSEPGTWTIMEGWIGDRAHNGRSVHESELAALGFPTTFTVASTPDTTPPLIACTGPGDCTLTESVDVSQGPGTITARARLRDDLAGVNVLSLPFRSPTGIQYLGLNLYEWDLLPGSGTLNDGLFESTTTVPQFSELGVWRLTAATVGDRVQNNRFYTAAEPPPGVPTTFHVCHGTEPCNDGDPCTIGEACSNGLCVGGAMNTCDDGDACTADSCDAATGCQHTLIACDDGLACTTDTCDPSVGCVFIADNNACNDHKPCTDDACVLGAGCVWTNITGECDDGDACTIKDHCVSGACVGGPARKCDDEEECTDDACEPDLGCVHTPRAGACGAGGASCATNMECVNGQCRGGARCGDHVCCAEGGETPCTCPEDCGQDFCGNGCCGPGDGTCCIEDCPATPADGVCCQNETVCTDPACAGGKEPDCGDGRCDACAGETTCSCVSDCGAACGDGCCAASEVCDCPADCGRPDGDGVCCPGESACGAPLDCAPACGDGCCSPSELPNGDSCGCVADCGSPQCGDGVCACGETACGCPSDCDPGQDRCSSGCDSPTCGDGCCGVRPDGTLETACDCVNDCAPRCGDGCCSAGETPCSCPDDCEVQCGDGRCDACAGETACSGPLGCPADCGAPDDGVCCGGESVCNSDDCGKARCGDGSCDTCLGETCTSCPEDCSSCGDGCCSGAEDNCSCPADCQSPPKCGNGKCEACDGEDPCSCPGDCGPPPCGDGICCGSETACSCPGDCGVVHGDGQCCSTESVCDEPACGPIKHGDGVCCPGESACDEPACGPGYCGDGCCGAGEDACSCYADCASSVTCLTLRRGELGDIADTYLGDANPTYVGGARPIMYIGPTSPGKEYKPLLRFDLGLLPIGAHVFSATLHIPPVLTGSIIPQFGYVYPVLSPWDEATVTANNFGASSNFGASQQTFVLTAGHSTTMDLTGMVQLWVDGSKPNHGLMLRAPKGAVRALYSGDRAEPKERPRLDLCYATCEKK